ncbi:hypothetical protein HDU93_000219 [Gonapodya sp. JEL0774]|nr:hypothetical protein HDU93_000219 [Gonapodya sp. JEL0774]
MNTVLFLNDAKTWRTLHKRGNEVKVGRAARPLLPPLRFTPANLHPHCIYSLSMDMHLAEGEPVAYHVAGSRSARAAGYGDVINGDTYTGAGGSIDVGGDVEGAQVEPLGWLTRREALLRGVEWSGSGVWASVRVNCEPGGKVDGVDERLGAGAEHGGIGGWDVAGYGDWFDPNVAQSIALARYLSEKSYTHPDGCMRGESWMIRPISFPSLGILDGTTVHGASTDAPHTLDSVFPLVPNFRYIPRIHLVEHTDGGGKVIRTCLFAETAFVAVTKYTDQIKLVKRRLKEALAGLPLSSVPNTAIATATTASTSTPQAAQTETALSIVQIGAGPRRRHTHGDGEEEKGARKRRKGERRRESKG